MQRIRSWIGPFLGVVGGAGLLAFSSDFDVSPIPETLGNDAVVEGRCGQWSDHGLKRAITSAPGPWDLEQIVGSVGCDGASCQLDGWKRWTRFTSMTNFEVRNKLWFFNTDDDDPAPGGAEYAGNQSSTDEARDHVGSGMWSRKYTYTPGTGELASRGVKARLYWKGTTEIDLTLVNTTPLCATGGCVEGSGTSKTVFQTVDLDILSSELRKFFQNREREEQMQEWYVPSPDVPETLRRKASLHLTWCTNPEQTSWNFGIQCWPPGFEMGESGSTGGHLKRGKHSVKIDDKDIELCIRPPTPGADEENASFQIMVAAAGETQTRLLRTQLAEATARVTCNKLEIRFERGCVDCDPQDDGVEIDSTGSGFTAG